MTFKFFFDECLSHRLVQTAIDAGHGESSCVRNRGWLGKKDHELIELVVAEDFTLVTQNSVDFRGSGPGRLGGEHAKQPIHAGLVCLNSEQPLDLGLQQQLFVLALEVIEETGEDLVNKALDIFHYTDGRVEYEIYDIPEAAAATIAAATSSAPEDQGQQAL